MYITAIFTATGEITILHVQMKTEPFNRNKNILHPSSHCMKSQSFPVVKKMMHSLPKGHFLQSNLPSLFRIEISSEHSLSFEEIVHNENNNNPNKSVWESQYPNLTNNDNIESKPTERDTEYNGQKEPTPPLPSIDGAYSIIKSTMPLSVLCKYSYILLLITNF